VIFYSRKNCGEGLDEGRREAKLARLAFTVLRGALEKPGNLCLFVGDRCKCSDDFLQAYGIRRIVLCMVVCPPKLDNKNILLLFEAFKI
jgi:hypothetical protein